jgi:hypothetical protein
VMIGAHTIAHVRARPRRHPDTALEAALLHQSLRACLLEETLKTSLTSRPSSPTSSIGTSTNPNSSSYMPS